MKEMGIVPVHADPMQLRVQSSYGVAELNSLPTRTLYAVLNSMLSESADDDIGDDDKTMTAVSRVCAAQPEAFWLACERGCDTLFVHDAVRQEKCIAL